MDVGKWGVDFTLLSQRGQARESGWQEKLHSEEKVDCPSWWDVRRLFDIAVRDEAKEVRPVTRPQVWKQEAYLLEYV